MRYRHGHVLFPPCGEDPQVDTKASLDLIYELYKTLFKDLISFVHVILVESGLPIGILPRFGLSPSGFYHVLLSHPYKILPDYCRSLARDSTSQLLPYDSIGLVDRAIKSKLVGIGCGRRLYRVFHVCSSCFSRSSPLPLESMKIGPSIEIGSLSYSTRALGCHGFHFVLLL
jgi:hypothetical protein